MAEQPTGTVTFLFTDIEGSTRAWEAWPEAMTGAVARHDELLRAAVEGHGGVVVKTTGDGLHAAFGRAQDALVAAVTGQRALTGEDWALPEPLRARMGLHTGEAEPRDGDYFGSVVNRAARLSAAAHGGQVVLSRVTEELVRDGLPEGISLVDLGEHRLRDLARPERVFQVQGPGLDGEFPPLRTGASVPTNLPVPPTDLIGRDEEVAGVVDLLAAERLVTITGVGGMGKTRLAVEAASASASGHPDGVWFVDLAPALDGGEVVRAVAAAMGATGAAASTAALLGHLAERRTLLVLDNCEHVIDAVAELTTGILARSAEVRVLATSREPLDVAGESVKHLRPLALPDATEVGPTGAGGFAAVRLFEERARAARSGFVVDDDNVEDVVEICCRLDGVPLALELAAARVGAMSTRDIRSRLGERFRLLAGSRRGHERHRTLLAAVGWSYDLLDPDEQRVFRSLSVFAGSFGLADAVAVAGGEDGDDFEVIDTVARLVERSLVSHDGETGRYRLLETLRQYGDDRLVEAGEAEPLRTRAADHFLAVATREGPRLFGADHDEAEVVLAEAMDNLRATADWLGVTDRLEDLASFVSHLWLYLSQEAPAEGKAWLQPVLERATEVSPQVLYNSLCAAGTGAINTGAIDEAMALHQQGQAVARDHPDIRESGWALQVPVTIAIMTEDREALPICMQMTEIAERLGDPAAALYGRCATVYLGSLEGPDLLTAVEARVAEANALDGPISIGTVVSTCGGALSRPKEVLAANAGTIIELQDANPGWRSAGSVIAGNILATRALALTFTHPAAALSAADEALRVVDRIGLTTTVVAVLKTMALAASRLGETDAAALLLRHSLAGGPAWSSADPWMGTEVADLLAEAGVDPAELAPEALGRAELFAIIAGLQQRHPAPATTRGSQG